MSRCLLKPLPPTVPLSSPLKPQQSTPNHSDLTSSALSSSPRLTSKDEALPESKVFFKLHPTLDFVELHGLLHLATTKVTGTLSSTSVAVVVPLSYVDEVLKAFHEDPLTAG